MLGMPRTTKSFVLDPRCTLLEHDQIGPFARLGNGHLLTFDEHSPLESADEGRTWTPRPLAVKDEPEIQHANPLLLRTRRGTVVLLYYDMKTYKWGWDKAAAEAEPDVRLDVWSARSLDDGSTWVDHHRVFAGYCGALINMIETSTGELVAPIQRLVREPSRHALCIYVSSDDGRSWKPSNVLDIGGHGHHDGTLEPAIVELRNGRLWLLIRTNLDRFWESFSDDKGRSWRILQPTDIDASSAPPYLLRLASGRIALAWNRLYATGKMSAPRSGGDNQLSATAASWQRDELALAFSEDEAKTWTKPAIVVRAEGGGFSYPYLFERVPGELWVSTRFSDLIALSLRESEFVGN
jgi:hypothetical protein